MAAGSHSVGEAAQAKVTAALNTNPNRSQLQCSTSAKALQELESKKALKKAGIRDTNQSLKGPQIELLIISQSTVSKEVASRDI